MTRKFTRRKYFIALAFMLGTVVLGPLSLHPVALADNARETENGGVTFASEHLRLTAYFGEETVRLVFSDGRTVNLPQTVSASGARYYDGSTLFWNKGNEATVTLDGVTYEIRVAEPHLDPWELAQRSGVDFRAVGQEPGWLLDIREGQSISLLLDYGDTHIKTPIATLEVNYRTGAKTYRTFAPASPLDMTVIVQEEPCYDSMSGEGFTSSVTLLVGKDGRTYHGCGRSLTEVRTND